VELVAVDQGGHFLSLERSNGPWFKAQIFKLQPAGHPRIAQPQAPRGIDKEKLLLDLNALGIP